MKTHILRGPVLLPPSNRKLETFCGRRVHFPQKFDAKFIWPQERKWLCATCIRVYNLAAGVAS